MNKKLLLSLNHFLLLMEATLSISHINFIEELSDEQALDIMESLLESYEFLLEAIKKGATTNQNVNQSLTLLYKRTTEILEAGLTGDVLNEKHQARLENIKSRLEKIGEGAGEGRCIALRTCS